MHGQSVWQKGAPGLAIGVLLIGLLAAEGAAGSSAPPSGAEPSTAGCERSPYQSMREPHPGGADLFLSAAENPELPGVEVSVAYESGSATSTTWVSMRQADGARTLQVELVIDFGEMLNRHPVPADLRGEDETRWRSMLEHVAFSQICDAPDPSLRRLLHPQAPLEWIPGRPEMPDSYALWVEDDGSWPRARRSRS